MFDLVIKGAIVADGATYENPRVGPLGMPHVLVNGQFAVRDGKHVGSRSGRALRRGQAE